jgi:hypothetical protein
MMGACGADDDDSECVLLRQLVRKARFQMAADTPSSLSAILFPQLPRY